MKQKLMSGICCSLILIGGTLVSCEKSDAPEELSSKESALKAAVSEYVERTVYPTYGGMADAAIELADRCAEISEKYKAGTLQGEDVRKAGESWRRARKYWELSEAFLFGPATDHYIDPHIDSWPLDKDAMDALLEDLRRGATYTIDNNFGYGLLGFHSLEYMLFELDSTGEVSSVHSVSYTPEELTYMQIVADDLRNQCVYLEACWKGAEGLSERKRGILEEAELEPRDNYGEMMKNSGKAGSIFKTYQEAAEEIIQGCIDIADEVGTVKIGRPHEGSTEEDRNYIESPYSLNSIEDFIDNIRSIENSYLGSGEASSLSSYFAGMDPGLDRRMRESLENSKRAIGAIPEPFAKNATGKEAAEAVRAVGTDLVNVLNEIHVALSKEQ